MTSSYSGSIITREFISADQTIVAAGLMTIPHGLGQIPKFILPFLKCAVANENWSVGDITSMNDSYTDAATARGFAIYADATNIYIRACGATNLYITNKTTGFIATSAFTNWNMFVKAYL